MKSKIQTYSALLIAAILMTLTTTAQDVHFGVKGGLNLYNVSNSPGSSYDMKAGLYLGMFSHIHLSKSIALQPELIYSSQGGKYTSNNTAYTLKLNYLNLPIMLQYMFDNGFRLEAGPQFGFLLSAKNDWPGNSVDVKSSFKGIDFGVGLGAGYFNPKSNWGVGVRYNAGLSNIRDNSPISSNNNGFQVGVSYQFKHK